MRWFSAAAALAVSVAPAVAAPILEQFPATNNNSGAGSTLGGVVAYQPFRLDRDATLRRVAWVGDAFPPATEAYRVALFSSAGTFTPGALLYGETSVADRITPLPFQFSPMFPPVVLEQRNEVDLDVDVLLTADTQYFLSIAATTPGLFYGWKTFEDGCCSITILPSGFVSLNGIRLSLGLYDDRIGTVETPAPAALALFGLGVVMAGATRNRRRVNR